MTYSLSHLGNETLLRDLAALVARDRATTAQLLAHLAEVDARRLYLPAGYPSMYAYCVGELHMSEDAAFKRIRAARTARRFPGIFTAVADGRLHLSGVVLLTPHLTEEDVDELIAVAAHQSKTAIELLLAERFPQPDVPARLEALMPPAGQLAPGPVVSALPDLQLASAQVAEDAPGDIEIDQLSPGRVEAGPTCLQLAPRPVEQPVPERIDAAGPRSKLAPLAPERYALQLTVSQSTHDKLRHAQALLSHRIANGDLTEVLDRVLDLAIEQLEKRRFAATERPRRSCKPSAPGSRHIPAPVQRAVWQRDGGRCTFVSERGLRCPAREHLEFDHVIPVARGGQAMVSNVRLRCRAHNQYEAESTFGMEFMRRKRQEARERSEARESHMLAKARAEEIVPGLRHLGFSADEARRAADFCERMPEASIEERFRTALAYLRPKRLRAGISAPVACGPCRPRGDPHLTRAETVT